MGTLAGITDPKTVYEVRRVYAHAFVLLAPCKILITESRFPRLGNQVLASGLSQDQHLGFKRTQTGKSEGRKMNGAPVKKGNRSIPLPLQALIHTLRGDH